MYFKTGHDDSQPGSQQHHSILHLCSHPSETSDVTAAKEQGETVSLMFEAIVNNVPDKHKQPVEPETVRSLQRR